MTAKGFTLLELLITVAIIAMLSAVAISSFTYLQKNSRDTRRMSDLKVIQSALEQYRADQGFYPTTFAFVNSLTNQVGRPPPLPSSVVTYLNKIPKDPISASRGGVGYTYLYLAFPNNLSCDNSSNSLCTRYCIYANLEVIPDLSDRPGQCRYFGPTLIDMFIYNNYVVASP